MFKCEIVKIKESIVIFQKFNAKNGTVVFSERNIKFSTQVPTACSESCTKNLRSRAENRVVLFIALNFCKIAFDSLILKSSHSDILTIIEHRQSGRKAQSWVDTEKITIIWGRNSGYFWREIADKSFIWRLSVLKLPDVGPKTPGIGPKLPNVGPKFFVGWPSCGPAPSSEFKFRGGFVKCVDLM